MSKNRVIYYSDELNDDFAGTHINTKKVDSSYCYEPKSKVWHFFAFIVYTIIVKPIVTIFVKLRYHQKFVNKKLVKDIAKTGAFLYGNHTNMLMDVFVPNMLTFRAKTFVISNPDAVSMPALAWLTKMLGTIPLGSDLATMIKMFEQVNKEIANHQLISIYPEAHIWPFYTKIRPFTEAAFKYVTNTTTPVYVLTCCYKKRKLGKRPRAFTYIDGPFYRDSNLSSNEAAVKLRNQVYDTMVKRTSENSTYEYVTYIKKETNPRG